MANKKDKLSGLHSIERYIKQAENLIKQGKYKYYYALGNIYSNGEHIPKNIKKAISYYEKFSKIHTNERPYVDEINFYIDLGKLYKEINKPEKSQEAFIKAIFEIRKRFPDDEKEQIRQQKRHGLDKLLS